MRRLPRALLLAAIAVPAAALPRPDERSLAYFHGVPWEDQGRAGFSMLAFRGAWPLPRPSRALAVALLVEPKAGYAHRPEHDPMAGFAAALQLRFQRGVRLEAGGGPLWVDSARVTSALNFELFAGPVVERALRRGGRVFLGYRYQHVSNAGTRMPNPGTDSHLAFAGFGW